MSQDATQRAFFFHTTTPPTAIVAIKPRTTELGSGTLEMAPIKPFVLLSRPAVK
jgi:hypothetical protein